MRKLWAVGRTTYIEGFRSRLTLIGIAGLLLIIVGVPLISRSASPQHQMQTFLAYSVGLNGILLSLLTIMLTCSMVCWEVEHRRIFTSMTKPLARWQYVVGRWIGIGLIQATLIAGVGIAIYGTAYYLRYHQGATDSEHVVNREVLCARVSHGPSDTAERIVALENQRVAELRRLGEYDSRVAQHGQAAMDDSVRGFAVSKLEAAAHGETLEWTFRGLPRPADVGKTIQLSIKLAADNALGLEELQRTIKVINPFTGESMTMTDPNTGEPTDKIALRFPVSSSAVSAPTIVELPASLISDQGVLKVTFINEPPPGARRPIQSSVNIDLGDVRVLYRVGGFAGNLARALYLVWLLQAFLAAVSLLAATWLSFPIACLWAGVLYIIGMMASFLLESVVQPEVGEVATGFGYWAAQLLLAVVPDFNRVSPTDHLVGGLLITWSHLWESSLVFVVVWSGLSLSLAALIFTRRELARVIA